MKVMNYSILTGKNTNSGVSTRNFSAQLYIFASRTRWRTQRARFLKGERASDEKSRALEERQAEHLRQESESFLAKQMEEMQSLADEQRKAGLLLDDSAPVKLSIASTAAPLSGDSTPQAKAAAAPKKAAVKPPAAGVFGADEEEDDPLVKRKAPLVKIDFGGLEPDSRKERLEKLRASIKSDKDSLFKAKIRWDGITDVGHDFQFTCFSAHLQLFPPCSNWLTTNSRNLYDPS